MSRSSISVWSLSFMPPYSSARKCSERMARWARLAWTWNPSTTKVTSETSLLLMSLRRSSMSVGGGITTGS